MIKLKEELKNMNQHRRLPAEWEPQSAILMALPHPDTDWRNNLLEVIHCYQKAIELISQYQPILLLCHHKEEAQNVFGNHWQGDVRYVEVAYNDTWCRDYGAITVFEEDHPILLDFTFNGWGLKYPANKDNQVTQHLWDRQAFNAWRKMVPDIVLEGGAIESDGKGTLLTTKKCMLSRNRNPHLNKSAIEAKLSYYLGANRILWLNENPIVNTVK